ncbi:MAG TPA: pyridoxal-phosphate dependent enzyme, partial [Thermomicrobiales bacterium]|nr:pyridoxal-phosphate dependent enzyme [Thermomicrobiales bacterium]
GVQPADYNALEIAEQNGLSTDQDLRDIRFDNPPPTILVKLQHTYPYDGAEALTAIHDTGGRVTVATDVEALAAQARIGATEGIYIEPSSAVSLVAVEALVQSGAIHPTDTVVGILTGSGHRETHILAANHPPQVQRVTMANGLDVLADTLGVRKASKD